MDLREAIAAAGYEPPEEVVFDGELHRFATDAHKSYSKDGWYVAHNDTRGMAAAFGSWRDGAQHTWSNGSEREFTASEREEIKHKKKQAIAEEKAERNKAASRAHRIFGLAEEVSESHPYLQRKGIGPPQGVRQIRGLVSTAFGFDGRSWEVNAIIVPMRDAKGNIRSLQLIPDNPQQRKLFMKGGQTASTFHVLGSMDGAGRILICEGLATGQSLFEARALPTVIAFSAGNLPSVAEIVRSRHATASITICADDDEAGRKYAEQCNADEVLYPGSGYNDFNDLHVGKGIDAVRSVIAKSTTQDEPDEREGWRSDLFIKEKDDGTQTIPCRVHNLILILDNAREFRGRIRYNEFSEKIVIDNDDQDDIGPIKLKAALEKRWIMEKVATADVREAISVVARENRFHPVLDYLDGLHWDGIERIDDFFPDVLGTPKDAYHMGVSNALFVSAIARVRCPGCKADHITILISPQGLGKTELWKALFGEWTEEIISGLSDKDFFAGLRGLWCADFGELDAFTKAEESRIKLVLSQRTDYYRTAYGRAHKRYLRQHIWVGGTNNEEYSKDPTGDRRSLPVKVLHPIDISIVDSMRDQLWAEADVRYLRGDSWWIVPDAEEHQAEIYHGDSWEEIINGWLHGRFALAQVDNETFITIKEVLNQALEIENAKQGRSEQNRASAILRRLGWRPARRSLNKQQIKVYLPPRTFDP